ncbi:prepilin peptidase, partial [Salmonella enterica subsp. enterica serovar Muenchen]|nr:prepilin peptidase [Salmonella enterica subsp. enterica serovar Muenchen]EBW2622324.1 prepilin peptidase [Salmonella enterica subsp. enterica serovar Muenchen]EBY7019649.1 prepilin peptidase [Salmonella enterica subsp. enterica serovar Muenchen]
MAEQTYYWLFFLLCLLTGMCAGSFMNVVIYRLPLMIFGTGDGDER